MRDNTVVMQDIIFERGAAGPEMNAIERLLSEVVESFVQADVAGKRPHAYSLLRRSHHV